MSKFSLVSGSTTETGTPAYDVSPTYLTDEEEEDNLPYPKELQRSDFLKPDFDPQEYLSSLRNRHQALEDLRSDLRSRSQSLNQELLDLVNGNYEEFLSLGADLNGGEDKVEGVRVGLLGFTRDIEALRLVITSRETEFEKLLSEAKQIRHEVVLGRKLLDIEASIAALEAALSITGTEATEDDDILDGELDDEDTEVGDASLRKLMRRTENFAVLGAQMKAVGSQHPFLTTLEPRVHEIRKVLILDMSAALRQARSSQDAQDILCINRLFSDIGAEREAVQLLKAK
ncbi:hypothetical protein AMS68_007919 [Peltaster fructicola]|uniref:Conserved oligomeric Golgi complex subunit 2 n=1 Tax=Peltaster fructicola TaxID=286661 RepID=A0A6H0Y5T5_9PEZI|nr:hypothetical protein AMS68_007919 [Peltaster fructicola]